MTRLMLCCSALELISYLTYLCESGNVMIAIQDHLNAAGILVKTLYLVFIWDFTPEMRISESSFSTTASTTTNRSHKCDMM